MSGGYRDRNDRGSAAGFSHGERWLDNVPLHRLGTPADEVAPVPFPCVPEATCLTGQAIHVDGGKVMS